MAYPRVVRRADETAALARREKPDVAVLIDSWGFTLRVAQRLRAARSRACRWSSTSGRRSGPRGRAGPRPWPARSTTC